MKDTDTPRTVCVIGGGPSGLSAARALEQAGHHAIVLEAQSDIAGKCQSIEIKGHVYDWGGHICTTRYRRLAQLVRELRIPTEATTPHHIFDCRNRTLQRQDHSFFQRRLLQRYFALRERSFPAIGESGLAHSARALSKPVDAWLDAQNLQALAAYFGATYTCAGYGYLDTGLPALYLVKYAEMTGLLSEPLSLLGYIGTFTVRGGFHSLWHAVAAELSDVRCGVMIRSIQRQAQGVRVQLADSVVQADDLLITAPLDQVIPLLDASPEERDIAARIHHIPYVTTLCSAKNLPTRGFYLFDVRHMDCGRDSCVSLHHRYEDQDVYACYSYADVQRSEQDVIDQLEHQIKALGGEVTTIHQQRRWRYMPHFGTGDLCDGILDRLEALQGKHRTYYAGSLLAFEMVECNIAYSQDLVARHFACLTSPDVTTLYSGAGAPASTSTLSSKVPPSVLFELPTINALAEPLASPKRSDNASSNGASRPRSPIVPLDPGRPFFCIGGLLGNVHYLRPLAHSLGLARTIYSIQAPGYEGHDKPLNNIGQLAARYVDQIRAIQSRGPYCLGGHSFGGIVAYEMGCQLAARNESVERILMLDSFAPTPGQHMPPEDSAASLYELLAMHRYMYGESTTGELAISADMPLDEQCRRFALAMGIPEQARLEEHVARMLDIYHANQEAFVRYTPRASALPVTLCKAMNRFPSALRDKLRVQFCLDEADYGWARIGVSQLTVVPVAADHFNMVTTRVHILAEAMRMVLNLANNAEHKLDTTVSPALPLPLHAAR